ncbi:MAG: lysine N(6)-hydroxylase/L-ornithine N(5)-oxygenase family protein [Natronosporangium sp.]
MKNREVELLAIGGGPANLALAVAIEELGSADLADRSLVVERSQTIQWQQGLLMPWAKSQVSFLKDVVTLRDPRSRFSFLNYLHSAGRLDDFVNLGSSTPHRIEISGYLRWVAGSLSKVRLELGRTCTSIEPRRDERGALTGWVTGFADGTTVTSRYLVIGAGRDPYLPPVFAGLPPDRVIHSTQYRSRVEAIPAQPPKRVVVVGSAESAAEMFQALPEDLPGCDLVWVMRSIGLKKYDTNKFVNELFYPSFVDHFFAARPEGRAQILREMHRTNYSGVAAGLLDNLYSDLYLDRLTSHNRRRVVTMAEITAARQDGEETVLELTDRKSGTVRELRCDLVCLGTGFVREMPTLIRRLAGSLGLDRVLVNRQYRLIVDGPATAACYLQGVNEATHGIADSLLSVLAPRAADITRDILSHRRQAIDGHHTAAGRLEPEIRR